MKFFLLSLLLLNVAPTLWACNIPEKELVLRLAIMKADQAREMHLNGQDRQDEELEGNISKKEFNQIIDSVNKVYRPIFKNQNMNFRIETSWEDKQNNAYAGLRGNERYILVYGGYARHKLMTKDAFLSIVCHEVGHHLGGFPRKANSPWSSSEGQADYFSTLKCMKEVLKNSDDNEAVASSLILPEEVKDQCRYQYAQKNDYWICLRSAKASEDYGKVVADLTKYEGVEISLMNPSQEIRSSTNLQHPSPQCRVDTKFQGALCNVPTSIPLDAVDEHKGACTYKSAEILGSRPACWFVHKS